MRVLISGAGVAGPTLAHFLARAGSHVTVVERAPELLAVGQNLDLKGSAITAMKRMGLLDELQRYNTTEVGTRFVDGRGRAYASFPVSPGGGGPSPTAEFEVLRGDLAKLIYEKTRSQPKIEYRFGTTVDRVVSNDDDAVRVSIGGREHAFDVVVAADGQWSRIRKQCFDPATIRVVDKDLFIAYFAIPRSETDDRWWNVHVSSRARIVTARPDAYGNTRPMFCMMPGDDAERQQWMSAARSGDRTRQKELVAKTFADAGWQSRRFLEGMRDATDFYLQAVQQIRMDRWSTGRVVCLGDAAYAPTPLTGAGATLAVSGAYVLAGELSRLQKGQHPRKALEAYEEVFRPFVKHTQDIPRYIPRAAYPRNALHYLALRGTITTAGVAAGLWRWWAARKKAGGDTAALGPGDATELQNDGFVLPDYEAAATSTAAPTTSTST